MQTVEEYDREFLARARIVCDGLPEIPRSGSGPEPEPEGVGEWPGIVICICLPLALVGLVLLYR